MLIQQNQGVIPAAILRSERDLPMVKIAPGLSVQLLQVDFDHNIRITRSLLDPGMRLRTHLHTGHVFAWTLGGTWKYEEYPESSTANSYLYEPAGSDHTLMVPEDSTEPADVVFIVHGSNIEKDAQGNIVGVTDAATIARAYLRACSELGLPRPDVIGLPPEWQGMKLARTQQERRTEAEAKLLATARQLTARKGWAGTTLADVGLAAGYSRGLAAHYFGSKAGLLREITKQINNSFFDQVYAAQPSQPGIEALLSFVSVYLGRKDPDWTNTRALLLLMTEALLNDSENADLMAEYNRSVLNYLQNHIRAGIERGEIDPSISPGVGAEAIVGMLRGMMLQRLVQSSDIGAAKMRDQLLVLLRRALGASPAGLRTAGVPVARAKRASPRPRLQSVGS